MSLATRCTQCGTIFKVVQDQLKVSEGWVRCGRCHEVFNALEGLFDLERDPPPARRRPAPAGPDAPQREPAPAPQAPTADAAPPSWESTAPLSFGDDAASAAGAATAAVPPAAWGAGAAPAVPTPPAAAATAHPGPAVDDLPAFLLKPRPAAPPPAAFSQAPAGEAAPVDEAPSAEPPDEPAFDASYAPRHEPAPGPVAAAVVVTQPPARHPLAPPAAVELPSTHEDDALDSRWLMSPTRDERAASERLNREAHTDDFADAQFPQDVNEDLAAEAWSEAPSEGAAAPSAVASGGKDAGAPKRKRPKKGKRPLPADAPDFVKRAERRAQWRHPAVRATLGLVALALLGLLLLQGGYRFKDQLAARWPQSAPVVEAMCALAGCEVGAPLQDDALTVESHKLSRPAGAAAEVYRLSLVLHNKADYAVAAPHVELTLKDANDSLLSRRTLSLAELGYTAAALPASGNVELQLLFASASQVSGYDVGIFYP